MNKVTIFICLCIFIFVTALVMGTDSTNTSRRVKFTNRDFEISNEYNEFENRTGNTTPLHNNSANIRNQDLYGKNSGVIIQNDSANIHQQHNSFDNKEYRFTNQNNRFEAQNQYDIQKTKMSDLDAAMDEIERVEQAKRERQNRNNDQYRYRNIDWNKWKSNFANKILDDSVAIKELDKYPNGAWFYYSFIVDNEGRISNIGIKSPYLKQPDREKVIALINSYAYEPITDFPPNSARKTVRVEAVMLLSNSTTKHASPKDFNDTEVVKYKIKQ